MTLCIQDTQEYTPCREVYLRWLQATQIERENLILRGLGYNQKEILDQLSSVSQGGLSADSLKGLPWDGLINGYDKALEALGKGSRNTVVVLTTALGGCFTSWAGKAVDGVIGPGLVALGLIACSPVVMVEVTMSKANAIAELTARMMALNPKLGQLKDLNRAIEMQMRKAGIYGVPIKGTGRFRYLIMTDPQVVQDFPGMGANGLPTARRFAESALLTEADRARMTQLRWRKLMPTSAGLGLVTGILQIAAMSKLADDLDKSMQHERSENTWRFRTSVVGLAGTLAETTGKWVESAAEAGSRYAIRIERTIGMWLRIGGKALGIGAGVVMALWDGIRGVSELNEGNGVGLLYIASGFVSLVALGALSGWFGATIFGLSAIWSRHRTGGAGDCDCCADREVQGQQGAGLVGALLLR